MLPQKIEGFLVLLFYTVDIINLMSLKDPACFACERDALTNIAIHITN